MLERIASGLINCAGRRSAGQGVAMLVGARQGFLRFIHGWARLCQVWRGRFWQGLARQGRVLIERIMGMEVFTYHIRGVSPLLQHNPSAMGGKDQGALTKKKVYIPEEEAAESCYRNERGEYYIPTIAFRAAMLSASKGRKIGKTAARGVLSGCVFPVEQEAVLIDQQKGKPLGNYKIHKCRAVIQRSGILRVRPMFENWACRLALEIDTEMLPNIDVVSQVLNIAGKIIGVMDWRPERLGVYGRFTATLETT